MKSLLEKLGIYSRDQRKTVSFGDSSVVNSPEGRIWSVISVISVISVFVLIFLWILSDVFE